MKKLSFLLMAMLISLVSFAQEAPVYELVPATGSNSSYANNCDVTIEGITWNLTGNSTMIPWRIGGKSLTNQDRALYSKTPLGYNINKIEVTHGTASSITVNSFKLIISDEPNGTGETIDVAFKASATTTIELPEGDHSNKYFKFLYNVTVSGKDNKYLQFTNAKFYAALAADAVKAPIIDGEADFISETEVTIEAENDVTVYYTVDGTEPTTTSTVYTAPFSVKETTTVKAVAYRGETASFVTSATFTKATQVTCAEAAEAAMKVASNNAPSALTYVVYGYVTEVIDQTLSNGQQRFWVADTKDGGQVLQSYYCNVPQVLKVGDYVQMFGKLTKYNTIPQMKDGQVTLAEEPVVEEPTIECKDVLDFGATAYNNEVEGQILKVTGYNLTSDITVTLSEGAVFTVDQTTLPAEGGELVVTPVTPLAVGAHSATLTLTSSEATAEVALTVVAKDVYTITWSVNGETSTTSVVEGDKLVLPIAPETPETCSEKVFVGWTTTATVNADGSDITWVTAATVPTSDATYYAVFALASGEGAATTTEASVTIEAYATANGWENGTQYLSLEVDANVTATVTEGSNTGKYYTNGNNWRIYQNESPSLTIAAKEGTITSVTVTYTINNTGVLTLNNANVESGTVCAVNAASVTFGVGNTGSATNGQVRVTQIDVVYTSGAATTYSEYSTVCESDVVEPTTITWELNGGEFPAVAVPTNAELWEAFKPYYNTYYGLTRADQPIDKVTTFASALMQKIMTDPESDYKWLGDYVLGVAAGQGLSLPTDMAAANEGAWRWAVHAFFNATTGANGAAGTDFTEAGKPENWGPAYQAANGAVVLPTEPVETDYTLPTPVKTGFEFVGWYDNAEGTGEAMTVLPAGWAGTIYAIWKESATTSVENNIIVEQAVKVIRNGQVLIVIGDKTFNIMGQQVK